MADKNAAVIAKARSKYGKMLSRNDYMTLISKGSVAGVISALRVHPSFSEDFANTADVMSHRGQFEQLLRKRTFRIFTELSKFGFANSNSFYMYLIKREEISQIISAAMFISAGVYEYFIYTFPVFFKKYCSFDIEALANVRSFSELLLALRETPYYDVLAPLSQYGKVFPQIREIETALGRYFNKWLVNSINKEFDGDEQKELRLAVMRTSDMFNLKLCYRLKGLFKLSTEAVMENHIPVYCRFNKENMEELLTRADTEPILPLILKHPYFRRCQNIIDDDFESAVDTSNLIYYKDRIYLSQYDSVILYSFMELLDNENKNLTKIIEGLRYSLPPAEIEKMLII